MFDRHNSRPFSRLPRIRNRKGNRATVGKSREGSCPRQPLAIHVLEFSGGCPYQALPIHGPAGISRGRDRLVRLDEQ